MGKFSGLVLLLFSTMTWAQKTLDINQMLAALKTSKADTSRVNQLNKISLYYNETDTIKAVSYAKQALNLAQELQWKEGIAKANFELGIIYNSHFDYDQSLVYFQESLKWATPKLSSKIYLNIGGIYLNKSDFTHALDYLLRALKAAETIGDRKYVAKIATNLGSVYFGIQNYNKAITFFNKAAQLNRQLGNDLDLAIVYRNIAGVYTSLQEPHKALSYYNQAIILNRKLHNEQLQARILSDIALVYYNLGDYDRAIQNCHLAIKEQSLGNQNQQIIAFIHGVLGDSFIGKAKANSNQTYFLDSAIVNLNKAVKLHQQLNSSRDLAYDFSSLTQVHKLRGDYKSALSSYETAMVYEDSVFNFENKETIKNLEDKRAIELRDRELKIRKLQLEAKEKQKWMLTLGVVLLSIIGGMLFYQSHNRRKTNRKLRVLNQDLAHKNHELDQANKIKARFFSILNHDLRSPVYNLIHFLHLQKESPELLDETTKASIEKQTMESAENLVVSMEDMLLWSKGQMEHFRPQPERFKLQMLFEELKIFFASSAHIAFEYKNSDQIIVNTDVNYLKTIMRNLTSNAVKALEKTSQPAIVWKAWQVNETIYLSITDNGPGATQEQFKALYDDTEVVGIKTGLGLHLIRDLAKAIDCKISVETQKNEGTVFTLVLPQKKEDLK
ncbi:sensor histidine kinase [Flavobacterium sp. CYK-4]|uniref:ATP-binding protein n=1 Tax=Flavobacterium lotistagni TaxID=2709660 RepID=UPI00140C8DAE|nr:tetratricopeptide repeat-containing sensor histidine kinase [Flavobacterium lotistagni]NHM06731.1 sensor histidine kinase [Flavobacterium lotistagni]